MFSASLFRFSRIRTPGIFIAQKQIRMCIKSPIRQKFFDGVFLADSSLKSRSLKSRSIPFKNRRIISSLSRRQARPCVVKTSPSPSPSSSRWTKYAYYIITYLSSSPRWTKYAYYIITYLSSSPRWTKYAYYIITYLRAYGCYKLFTWVIIQPINMPHIEKYHEPEPTSNSNPKESSYRYGYLPNGYIRLVDIKPGKGDDPIELELKSVRFLPPGRSFTAFATYIPEYTALSYCWGTYKAEDLLPITLNGQPFHITPSLHSAILVIREKSNHSRLWIDAICLDQKDDTEKDRQLRIMHQIYKRATSVLIWLGDDDQSVDLDAAVGLISHFHTNLKSLLNLKLSNSQELNDDVGHTGHLYNSGWKAIQNILARPYFERSWIIQELVLSSRRTILLGHYDVTNIFDLVTVLHRCPVIEERIPTGFLNDPHVIPHIYELCQAVDRYWAAHEKVISIAGIPLFSFLWYGLSLGDVLTRFRGKRCEKPFDQVYSVLGLTKELIKWYTIMKFFHPTYKWRMPPFPEVNHKQSLKKLYTDATKYVLYQDGDLGFLRMIRTHERPPSEENWPSWVPDLSSPFPEPGDFQNAEWDLKDTKLPQEMNRFHIDDNKLIIYGHVLGELIQQVQEFDKNSTPKSSITGTGKRLHLRLAQNSKLGAFPSELWMDSKERLVIGGIGMRRGDVVVVVGGGRDLLVLRKLEEIEEKDIVEKEKKTEAYEYKLVSIVNILDSTKSKEETILSDIEWDIKTMIIK